MLTLAYVALCVFTVVSTNNGPFVPAASPDDTPPAAGQQWAFSASCPGGFSERYGCGGCTQLYGPPDAGRGCGFTCAAAAVRIGGMRSADTGVRNDTIAELQRGVGTVMINLAWEVDAAQGVVVSVHEPWTVGGRGAVRRVELLHGTDPVLAWTGPDNAGTWMFSLRPLGGCTRVAEA